MNNLTPEQVPNDGELFFELTIEEELIERPEEVIEDYLIELLEEYFVVPEPLLNELKGIK